MSNAKNARIAHIAIYVLIIGFIPLLSLNVIIPPSQATSSTDAAKWTKVSIPAGGEAGNWVLADGSDVQHLTMAGDGSLYACGNGLTYTLYRSADGGHSWTHIGNVQNTIVDIAVSPHDASAIYYATSSAVYRSINGGKTFWQLPASPGGAGTGNKEITSIDVAWLNNNIIAVGIRDADSSEFGGVYTMDEADIIPVWTDTGIGSYDAYAVSFSPNYASDCQLVAVITGEIDTLVTSRISDAAWGANVGNARLDKDNSGTPSSVAVNESAAIAFPANYNADVAAGNCVFFVAIDTGTAGEGDVYRINGADAPGNSTDTDLNAGSAYGQNNVDVTGLAAYGDYPNAILLAGAADTARTFISIDGGISWTGSRKEPTGASRTGVLVAPDFTTTGRMYATTSGDGSALSISRDVGATWNQLSLIDTAVSTIVDLAPSPGYSQDNTLFMITFGSEHSLWRSLDSGNNWERTLSGNLPGVDSLSFVGLPPQYGDDCRTVFVAGESDGKPAVWESTDNGQYFRRRFTQEPATGTAFSIDAWAIAGETALFIGSHNGTNGMVYQTINSGFTYSEGAPAGSQSLHSIALSPDYTRDSTILAGNTNGWVYWSGDGGGSFQSLPGDAASPPLTGSITVAFDPAFASNNTVYAASDTASGGVYRFIIGTGTDWESIDGTLPVGATLNQLAAAGEGTLYAASSDADGGMERCLNPTFSLGPSFETVTRGLGEGATLSGLWLSGNRVWSADTTSIRLMTFDDTLTSPVAQISPGNGASGIGSLIDHTIRNISLDWETLDGATSYQWQCAYDTSFASIPSGFEDSTSASSARLPALEPATTYHWRVRTSAPALSPWSEKWSFTTTLDTEAITLKPESPAAAATGVPVKPVFQWTAVAGADAYELLVSTDVHFTSPSIIKTDDYALPANAWRCDVSLDYGTTYYWKVRAISDSSLSVWSAAGAFTTELAPLADTEPPAELASTGPPHPQEKMTALSPSTAIVPLPATPSPLQIQPPSLAPPLQTPSVSQTPGTASWVIYLIGGLLLTIILALVTILAMVLKTKRL